MREGQRERQIERERDTHRERETERQRERERERGREIDRERKKDTLAKISLIVGPRHFKSTQNLHYVPFNLFTQIISIIYLLQML